MAVSLQNFVLEKEIVKGRHGFLVGRVGQDHAIVKLTLPTAGMSNLSFYTALDHQTNLKNDVYETALVTFVSELDAEIKCPATPGEVAGLFRQYHVVKESYEEYCSSHPSESWITKLLDTESGVNGDSVIHSDETILVVKHGSASPLRWSCIFRDPSLQSIRDIPNAEIVEDAKKAVLALLKDHGVPEHSVCLYFDYCGKDARLCMTIAGISGEPESLKCNGKFIYLDVLVRNLRISRDYYKEDIVMIKNK